MNVGIIGAGFAASIHAKVLRLIDKSTINIYVYDINISAARQLAYENNCTFVNDVEDLYSHVDAIIVATPSYTHYRLVIEAINRGKHVLCEKPMATTILEAEEMYSKGIENNLICAIGFNYRFFQISNILKNYIDIGKIKQMRVTLKRLFRKDWKNVENGVLSDLGIHIIDLIRYISNCDINLNSCNVEMKCQEKEDYDTSVIGCMMDGTPFQFTVSRTLEIKEVGFAIEIVGEKYHLKYDSQQATMYTLEDDGNIEAFHITNEFGAKDFFDFSDSFLMQDKEWINVIHGSKVHQLALFEDGYKSQMTLDYLTNNKHI